MSNLFNTAQALSPLQALDEKKTNKIVCTIKPETYESIGMIIMCNWYVLSCIVPTILCFLLI